MLLQLCIVASFVGIALLILQDVLDFRGLQQQQQQEEEKVEEKQEENKKDEKKDDEAPTVTVAVDETPESEGEVSAVPPAPEAHEDGDSAVWRGIVCCREQLQL